MVFIEMEEAMIYIQLPYLEQSGHNCEHQLEEFIRSQTT